MLNTSPYAKLIAELSTRRAYSLRPRECLRSARCLSTASRRLAAAPTPQESQSQPSTPPPAAEYTPSARDLQSYVAKVSSKNSLIKSATEPYAAFGGTEKLWEQISKQASYTIPNREKKPPEPGPKNAAGEDIGVGTGQWFAPRSEGGLEMPVTFINWAQVMYLYLYIITVRLRRFPAEHVRIWEQHLMDHFYYAAEERMEKWHGMAARGVRNKNLKDLWMQWRGALVSYDEGLIKGDAMLAAAVWRAIFKANPETRIEDVAWITAYLRQELQRIDLDNDERVSVGAIQFGDLSSAKNTLAGDARGAALPFSDVDTQQWQALMAESTTDKT